MVHKHTSTFRWSVNWGADEGVVVVVEYMGIMLGVPMGTDHS